MSTISTISLKIEGMHCSSCAMNIDFDLEELDGVTSSQTSYAKQSCFIEYDPEKVTKEQILNQVKKTGYIATIN